MGGDLAHHFVGEDFAGAVGPQAHHRRRRLVAGGFDSQYAHRRVQIPQIRARERAAPAAAVSIRLARDCPAHNGRKAAAAAARARSVLDDDGEALTKRIALMRARDDAARSAALLRARGFLAALAPAIEIRATGALPPRGPFDAVAATSAKAIALLAPAARAAIAGPPLYVVGEQTAEAAAEAGMPIAAEAAPDVAALIAALLRAPRAPFARAVSGRARTQKARWRPR